MKWTTTISEVGIGTSAAVMTTWTDVAGWPGWDRRESGSELDGPFAAGTTGRSALNGTVNEFTILSVGPDRWTNRCALPGGALIMDHLVEDVDGHRIRVSKTYTVTGPLVPLFALHFGRGIRRSVPATLTALLEQARRVSAPSA